MTIARRLTLTLTVIALIVATAYGVGWALRPASTQTQSAAADTADTAGTTPGTPDAPAPDASAPDSSAPSDDDVTPSEAPAEPSEEPTPEEPAEPALVPGPALLAPGDDSDEVADLQARLRQIDWFDQDVTGFYGDVTASAVSGFQAKREIPVTGEVDQRTMDRLLAMTTTPTEAELTNQLGGNTPGALDPRCRQGRVLCVDKTSQTLRWVVDGRVETTVDVRFGSEYTPTREGAFQVDSKSRDHVSSIYDTSMPFAMFFSGGQAVHYSPDFAAVGYAGASHGCVNVRDYDAIAALFDQVEVGDSVIVYRS